MDPRSGSGQFAPQGSGALDVFPFIVGSGRSGTTLFRAIFNCHSRLAIPEESHFIELMGGRPKRYESESGFRDTVFVHDLVNHPRFQFWELSEADVREVIAVAAPATLPEAIRAVFALYAEAQGKDRYADKTPNYVHCIPLLAQLFGEARFVHVVRDGRDVALSYLDLTWGPDDVPSAARNWRECVQRGRAAGEQLGHRRYREVRYEDFLHDPEPTLQSLCQFLGIAFEEGMLAYYQRAEVVLTRVTAPENHQRLRLPPTKGLRDWRREMSPHDVVTFESVAGDALSALGYERVTSGAGP